MEAAALPPAVLRILSARAARGQLPATPPAAAAPSATARLLRFAPTPLPAERRAPTPPASPVLPALGKGSRDAKLLAGEYSTAVQLLAAGAVLYSAGGRDGSRLHPQRVTLSSDGSALCVGDSVRVEIAAMTRIHCGVDEAWPLPEGATASRCFLLFCDGGKRRVALIADSRSQRDSWVGALALLHSLATR
eukprot:PLAT14105.1.p1 GENE.PLAT14105.1~~PLAT14105.1.p1  ORF type:complete len:191 (+),score=65.32 PLAT14105.1:36-608(+)